MMILSQVYGGHGGKMIAIIAVVIVILLIGVMVPLLIKKARKDSKRARNFVPDLIRMSGLQMDNNSFYGRYRGYDTTLVFGMGTNYAEIGFEALKGFAGGGMDLHQRNLFYQKFTIHIRMQKQLPELALKEKVGVLRTDQYIMDAVAGKQIELPEQKDLRIGKNRVFARDKAVAGKVVSSPELQNLLSDWHFLDVRVFDNNVVFTLDDNMINPTFGPRRLQTPEYIIQALDIAACVADLVSK